MASKKTVKNYPEISMMNCCTSWVGPIHTALGIGIGFLIASYTSFANLMIWGWILVGLGVLGHLVGLTKCKSCRM